MRKVASSTIRRRCWTQMRGWSRWQIALAALALLLLSVVCLTPGAHQGLGTECDHGASLCQEPVHEPT